MQRKNCESKKDKIREELADVLCYCILMADRCGLDMDEIVQEKMKRNGEKYPVEKAKDSAKKYDELQFSMYIFWEIELIVFL